MKQSLALAAVVTAALAAPAAAQAQPYGLLVDFKPPPSLGVRLSPRFGWVVPPCASHPDQSQTAYQIVVTDAVTGATAWDSGKVLSNESTYAAYAGAPNWFCSSRGSADRSYSSLRAGATRYTSFAVALRIITARVQCAATSSSWPRG